MAKEVKKDSKGKTPDLLVQKHIKDEDDIISDEDFKNVEVGTNVKTDDIELELPKDKNRAHDEDKDGEITTPWDVIK